MEKIIDSVRVHEAWSYIGREKVTVCDIVANSKGHMIITKKEKGFSLWGSSLYGHIKKRSECCKYVNFGISNLQILCSDGVMEIEPMLQEVCAPF
jgi:hypothetical protein